MTRRLADMVKEALDQREPRRRGDLLNAEHPCQCRICIDCTASLVEPPERR